MPCYLLGYPDPGDEAQIHCPSKVSTSTEQSLIPGIGVGGGVTMVIAGDVVSQKGSY